MWVRIDDRFVDHLKVISLPDSAFRLHLEALCFSARNLTDGFLPKRFVRSRKELRAATALVTAGLWEKDGNSFRIHDYLDYNPSAERVREIRKLRAEVGHTGGLKSAEVRKEIAKQFASAVASDTNEAKGQPRTRTRTNMTNGVVITGGSMRGGRDFVPPTIDQVREYVREKGYHFDPETFHAHHMTRGWKLKGGVRMTDWHAACVTFEKNVPLFAQVAGGNNGRPPNPLGVGTTKDGAGRLYRGSIYYPDPDGHRWLTPEGYRPDGTSTQAEARDPTLNEKVYAAMAGLGVPR